MFFGFTEAEIAQFGLFIIGNLAIQSKAGKFGTFILFVVLAFGILGFVAKNIIAWVLGI